MLDFHTFGVKKQNKQKKAEIGQMLVFGALDRTKKIQKTGADIFANFGAEKPGTIVNKLKYSPDVSIFSHGFNPKIC